jgi:hypothetical protein
MKYSELEEKVRNIVIECIDEYEIKLPDTEKNILKFVISGNICSLIMRNFKELEF